MELLGFNGNANYGNEDHDKNAADVAAGGDDDIYQPKWLALCELNINPIPPGLFEGGQAWGRRGGGKCPRPITLKLLTIMK